MASIFDILLYNVVAFLAVLTLIVAVHEAGHYLVARWCRVRVHAFSIGFGPELFGWTSRNGTRFKISALPLGGYVRMAGGLTTGTAEAESAADEGFPNRPIWQRALIIFAGPLANFIFAFLLLLGMGLALDRAVRPAKVGDFTKTQQPRRPSCAPATISSPWMAAGPRLSATCRASWRCTPAVR